MKFNKKLIVPFLATVTGLSITGGLGGAFAWYQFNSQVRTSFIGTSVADTGVLQIGYDDAGSPGGIKWGSMHTKPALNFVPVTFGALNSDKTLPANAWGYPEAGKQINNNYHDGGWKSMASGSGYYQYDIYLRALKADSSSTGDASQSIPAGFSLSAQDVYLSSMTLQDASHANPDDGSYIADALRVHLNVEGTDGRKELISRTALTSTSPLALNGYMDLDGDNEDDKYFVPRWNSKYGQKCLYGVEEQVQVTKGISDIVNPRNADGTITTSADKLICQTKTGTTPTSKKITITVWIEGWALLKNNSTDATKKGNVWNPNMNSGMQVNVDMVFDVGNNIIG